MRRGFIIILCTMICLTGAAQLEPLSDQYLWNMLAINPAYSGSQDALSVTLLHRNQWTGFNGAPKTITAALHTPTRNDNVGIGIQLINDRIGVYNSTGITGNFAYRIPVNNGRLSMGLGGGVLISKMAIEELVFIDADDELLMNRNERYFLPNFSIGLYYHTDRYFGGLSVPMFLSHDFNSDSHRFNLVNDYREYNYFITGGYIFDLETDWKLLPSLMVRYNPGINPQADINAYVIYRERIWAGLSYRSNNSLVGLLLYQVNKQLCLAYSHDFEFGMTGKYLSGSHEVMIRYNFKYLIDVISPRYF